MWNFSFVLSSSRITHKSIQCVQILYPHTKRLALLMKDLLFLFWSSVWATTGELWPGNDSLGQFLGFSSSNVCTYSCPVPCMGLLVASFVCGWKLVFHFVYLPSLVWRSFIPYNEERHCGYEFPHELLWFTPAGTKRWALLVNVCSAILWKLV